MELFTIVYSQEREAHFALQNLKELHQSGQILLKRAYIVARHSDNRVTGLNSRPFKLFNPKYGVAGLVGTVAGVVGAAPLGPGALLMGAVMGAVGSSAAVSYEYMLSRDLPASYRREILNSLERGNAAVVIEAEFVELRSAVAALTEIGEGEIIPYQVSAALVQELSY